MRLQNANSTVFKRMQAIREINKAQSFNATQRRVLVTLATYIPLNDPGEGWLLLTPTVAAETFGEVTRSTLNMTRKALRELEERGCIERVWAGSKRDHNEAATYFINWPDPVAVTQLPVVCEDPASHNSQLSITQLTVVPTTY